MEYKVKAKTVDDGFKGFIFSNPLSYFEWWKKVQVFFSHM
jgi:hypothetical protein